MKTMKKLFLAMLCLALTVEAQVTIQVRRGNAADRPALATGEPALDRDSLMVWMGSDSGNVPIGGRFMNYGFHQYGADAQASDTYVISLPNFDEPAYYAGMTVKFKAATVNTGAATINVNGLGAKAITKNGSTALDDGDIDAGEVTILVYDGTQFQLQGAAAPTSPTYNHAIVPAHPLGIATSSFGTGMNDSITFFAWYVDKPITLGEASIATGSLTGSCAIRTFGIAIYNSSLAIVDSTDAIGWPGNGTGGVGSFQEAATLAPGFYYVAFTTYNDNSCGQQFRSPDLSNNNATSAILASQNSSAPIIGYASEKLSAGDGWPATITVVKSTTTTLFPYIYIAGTNLD